MTHMAHRLVVRETKEKMLCACPLSKHPITCESIQGGKTPKVITPAPPHCWNPYLRNNDGSLWATALQTDLPSPTVLATTGKGSKQKGLPFFWMKIRNALEELKSWKSFPSNNPWIQLLSTITVHFIGIPHSLLWAPDTFLNHRKVIMMEFARP